MITQADITPEVVANLPLGQAATTNLFSLALPQLSAEDMGDWLVGQSPRAVVGVSQNPHSCPIANYIRARIDDQEREFLELSKSGRFVSVALGRVIIGRAKVLELSAWACEFVTDVDEGPTGHITASHALEVLERATARHRDA